MGIFTLAALIFILVCIFAEKSALPGNGLLLVRRHFFETLCALVWTKYASGNSAILKCMLVSIYIYEDRENPQLSECIGGRTWASAQKAHTEKNQPQYYLM